MKNYLLSLLLLLCWGVLSAQNFSERIITSDLDNYWSAYDRVITESDSAKRVELVQQYYVDKATQGLKDLMNVRRYTAAELADNMMKYQNYWSSIRANTSYLLKDRKEIEENLQKLKQVYPALQPANIYFAIGAFRSAGTYSNGNVLFGAEFMLAQKNTDKSELPERIKKVLDEYVPYDIPLIATHEYIHTQQKPWEDQDIIHLCVAEGVAEFISTLVTGRECSKTVKFGKANPQKVLDRYMIEIVRDDDIWNWLWSDNQNELKVNDLGYYIGYEICERHYAQASNKEQAVKEMIELDYASEDAFAKFVDGTHFLPLTIAEISQKYEDMRPRVARIVEFENRSTSVKTSTKTLTIEFDQAMSECCRSLDFDENPEVANLKVKSHVGWSSDKRQYTLELEPLRPNTTYALIISNFAKENGGNRLAPYTILFTTGE